jgi:hypothetical protein
MDYLLLPKHLILIILKCLGHSIVMFSMENACTKPCLGEATKTAWVAEKY